MIKDGRLEASLDQVAEMIIFSSNSLSDASLVTSDQATQEFDSRIATFCSSVSSTVESLAEKHPEYASKLDTAIKVFTM